MFAPGLPIFTSVHVHALHLLLLGEECESTMLMSRVYNYLHTLVTLVY
jgi:hypothetical protein